MGLREWLRDRFLLGPITEWPAISYEEVEFWSKPGVELKGWWLPAGSRKCVVLVHGGLRHRGDASIGTIQLAEGLVERGYNALMFDLRGHGDSGGEWKTAGYEEAWDVEEVFNWVVADKGILPENIVLWGFSMGAAASIEVASQNSRISTIISDSCWAEFSDIMRLRWDGKMFFRSLRNVLLQRFLLGNMPAVDPVKVVRAVSARILFIHGREDMTIPLEHAIRLFEASGGEASSNRLLLVRGASHVGSHRQGSEKYLDEALRFIEEKRARA